MSNSVFVGRETEIHQLETYLAAAAQGKAQVVFIAGEAGTGKSTLVTEFVRREEAADPRLITSMGECNAQTGIADPYLPFRQVLTRLTTENEAEKNSSEADRKKRLGRWKNFVEISTKSLIMLGPDLVGIFVPGAAIIGRIGMAVGLSSNLAAKLSEKVGKKAEAGKPKIDPALDQEKIFEEYAAVLKALSTDRTLVLVLDDLQWADSGSIALLFHLARQLKDSRILLVGTYRPDDVALGRDGERHPLESILNELKRYNGDIVINLAEAEAGKGRAFLEALVDSQPNQLGRDFRNELFAHTGGHPLFTVELLRNLQERGDLVKDAQDRWILGSRLDWGTLPARIDGVIGERVARLPTALHETLAIASVIGEQFAAQVVAVVQKADERELVRNLSRELEKRYMLITEQGERKIGKQFLSEYRFSHVMVQQYLYDELGSGERRLLHDEIARTLENLYGDQTDAIAVQLARHFEAAGNEEKATAYLSIAGDEAFCVYAYTEAIAAFTRALDLGRENALNTEQLKHLYLRRGRALELNNQYELALQNYEAMLATAQKCQDRPMEMAANVAASTLYSTPTPVADGVKGQRLSEETLKLARELQDRATEARALWNLQLVNLLHNKTAEAIDCGEESLVIARELNQREQMAYVLSDLGWAYTVDCQFEKADERMEEGARLWRELGNLPMLTNNLNISMFRLYWSGKDEKVLSVADEAFQISSSIGEGWNQASARYFQALVWFDQGQIGKSLKALEESLQLATHWNQNYALWYRSSLFRMVAELGGVGINRALFQAQRVANGDLPDMPMRTGTLVSYALFELADGQADQAAGTLAECKPDAPPWESVLGLARCRLALAQGDPAAAIILADSTFEFARAHQLSQYLPEALFLKGKSHFDRGERLEAKSCLEQARAEAEKLGSRHLLWQIFSLLSELESDPVSAAATKANAGEIVQSIASSIPAEDLREAFLRSASASRIFAQAGPSG